MLSNKMTFSLLSLVVLIAFGILCAVPPAFADGDAGTHFDITVDISAAENMIDVDYRGGMNDIQIATGRDRASRDYTAGDALLITLLVEFSQPVELQGPKIVVGDVADPEVDVQNSGPAFGADDIYVRAFDREDRSLGQIPLSKVATTGESIVGFQDARLPGRQFLVRVDESKLTAAYRTALRTPSDAGLEIASVFFFIPQGYPGEKIADHDAKLADGRRLEAAVARGVRKADIDHVKAHFYPDGHQHLNKESNLYRVDLVDDDEGDPQYAKITSYTTAMDVTDLTTTPPTGSGIPGVVSIMRTVDRSGFVESGEFDVRIILTEEPKGDAGLTKNDILVDNGSVVSVVPGLTYKGGHPTYTIAEIEVDTNGDGTAEATIPAVVVPERMSELGPEMVDYYHAAAADTTAAAAVSGTTDTTPDDGTIDGFPQATGRDNMYHSYIAKIRPKAGFIGTLTVSIKQFDDNVIPLANTYVPLTLQQRHATNLSAAAMFVRDARLMNETLSVQVSMDPLEPDTTFDASQAVIDANAGSVTALDEGLVIPYDTDAQTGYLVLAKGKTDSDPISGVRKPADKIAERTTAAERLYNVKYEFGLDFPADDLSNFFRNGGTLQLLHQNIPEHTTAGANADTGFPGNTNKAYALGDVIINEIMWGLDAGSPNGQYIELKNMTGELIGIDKNEWLIAVGTRAYAGYTVIDTVSNRSSSDYWPVPGSDGVTKVSAEHPALTDLVSMSRITGATNGKLAASWAESIIPSENVIGRRIGTPGAANKYTPPAEAPPPPPEPPPAMAPAATAADLMISEIMVASNNGKLPQWIEIKNTSTGEVSLDTWRVSISNDSADADVVASSLSIKLDGVVLDANQVALVVSKTTNRNSGVAARMPGDDNAGALDSNRIIDASSQIKPASMTYSMLSEMSFRISLEPPLPIAGGATVRGNVVGNLGGGWELPMSEAGRSSIIRHEGETGEIMGTDEAGWRLADQLTGAYVATYYGDKDDKGTPGYDAGGPLPVELSKFGAKRDPLTGQVIVSWETQSELNNAGFFIKRSQQKNAKFVAVNPTMIPGAGTTSEKQTYTYTDTTAQPNIVYYYQIEDVSLDGQRQTLTRAHRLKGHVGAAGKLTTLWGELKDRE